MKAYLATFTLAAMCRTPGLSTSGYYDWLRRPPSARARRDAALKGGIVAIWIESGETYGCPRIHAALLADGERVSRKRVARLMRELGIEGVTRRRFKTGTTKRDAGAEAAPDLVGRDFSAEGPDRLWVADITQVRTRAGWLYLAVVLDAWSRRIVGWAMAPRMLCLRPAVSCECAPVCEEALGHIGGREPADAARRSAGGGRMPRGPLMPPSRRCGRSRPVSARRATSAGAIVDPFFPHTGDPLAACRFDASAERWSLTPLICYAQMDESRERRLAETRGCYAAHLLPGVSDDPDEIDSAILRTIDAHRTRDLVGRIEQLTHPDAYAILRCALDLAVRRCTVAILSKRLGISTRTLQHRCTRLGLPSPRRIVAVARIFTVERLAEWSVRSPTAVARAVGFPERANYRNLVRRDLGAPPSVVRQQGGADLVAEAIVK